MKIPSNMKASYKKNEVALVFGASGEEGRAVLEGLSGQYRTVYAFTRQTKNPYLTDALGATLVVGDLQNPDDVRSALQETRATDIVLITATELPSDASQGGFSDAAEAEYQVLVEFFHLLSEVYQQDHLSRNVVLCTRDNVQAMARRVLQETGRVWIEPLDDGSIVPHYSAKGRGADYAVDYLKDYPELKLTRLTLPFFFSNFLGFFAPLPAVAGDFQWTLSACFGASKIDMMDASDLTHIVPNIFANQEQYAGTNLRLVGQQLDMDQVAEIFSDLFGRDVIYNPLTVQEVAALDTAAAPAVAQMCQFLSSDQKPFHDLDLTTQLCWPRAQPRQFDDWLLLHSDSQVFQTVGLDRDAPVIESVTVFGASTPEGQSVIAGLLQDQHTNYRIRAASATGPENHHLASHDRVEWVTADLDQVESCKEAVKGMDGVFLFLSSLKDSHSAVVEEAHAKNVIDACEGSVKHLVLATLESQQKMWQRRQELHTHDDQHPVRMDVKERVAAYARSKRLAVTYVLVPFYAEFFLDLMKRRNNKYEWSVHLEETAEIVCMSVQDLGPAVASIFDSHQLYAGHEIGLVTDVVTASQVEDMINKVYVEEQDPTSPVNFFVETEDMEARGASHHHYMKDLGQLFSYMVHSDAVQSREAMAHTLKLVPSARPLRQWVHENVDNPTFREKLGLR